MAITNSKRDAYGVFVDSDTDSTSDSDPGDDEDLGLCAPDTWPSTSDLCDEGLSGSTARLPGFIGGAANGLVTQPNATTKNDETETLPPAPAPLCGEASKDTAGAPLVKVPALTPLQPIGTAQDRHLMSLFGSEDNNEDTVAKATETPTAAAPSADYHTLVRDKPLENVCSPHTRMT